MATKSSHELPEGPTKTIHVNPAAIAANKPGRPQRPVCVVDCEGTTYHAFSVAIHGPSELLYEPERKGARVRIHTTAAITLTDAPPGES